MHRYLIDNRINNIVVHAASIEVSARDRVKTDKRDALKIAVQLSTHRLKGIFVPSLEQESKRNVTRLRKNFWQLRQKVGAKFKNLLFTQGIIKGEDDSRISQKWITEKLLEIETGNYPGDFYYSAKQYAKEWEDLTGKIKEIHPKFGS